MLPFLAPTMIVRLLDADPHPNRRRCAASSTEARPIHLEHIRAAIARFGPVFTQLYGQGESPMTISYLPTWAHDAADAEALQSAGFARTGVEIRILDADGAVVPQGRPARSACAETL